MNKHTVYHIARPGMSLSSGYVGITSQRLSTRFEQHKKAGNAFLKHAIAKYDDITIKALVTCDKGYALWLEEELRPTDKIGWNLVKGGGMPPSRLNAKHSAETIAKIVKVTTGVKQSEATILKRVLSRKGYKHSEETKAKMSKTTQAHYKIITNKKPKFHWRRGNAVIFASTYEMGGIYCPTGSGSHFTKVLNGDRVSAYGWKVNYD